MLTIVGAPKMTLQQNFLIFPVFICPHRISNLTLVNYLMLSSHFFFRRPLLRPPLTVQCRICLCHARGPWNVLIPFEPRHEKTCFSHKWTTKVQISLHISAADQHLRCSLPRKSNISSFYIRNIKPLASFCGWVGRFESHLVENPEDRISCDEAHLIFYFFTIVWRLSCLGVLRLRIRHMVLTGHVHEPTGRLTRWASINISLTLEAREILLSLQLKIHILLWVAECSNSDKCVAGNNRG